MALPSGDPRWTRQEVAKSIRRSSLWMEILGVLLIFLGFLALLSVVAASFATAIYFGSLLVIAGAAQIAATVAYWRRQRGGFALGMILGCLCVVAGILCLGYPAASLEALTLILGFYFIASGIARMVVNARERFPGWGWGMVSAVAEVLLGVLTLAGWPGTSLFILGTLLGVQLIFSGSTAFSVGASVRQVLAVPGEPSRADRPATRFQH